MNKPLSLSSELKGNFYILKKFLRFLWKENIAERKLFLLSIAVSLFSILVGLSLPIVFKYVIDLLDKAKETTIYIALSIIGFYMALWSSYQLIRPIQSILTFKLSERISRRVNSRFAKHVHDLSVPFVIDQNPGALISLMHRANLGGFTIVSGLLFSVAPILLQIAVSIGIVWNYYGVICGFVLFLLFVSFFLVGLNNTKGYFHLRKQSNQLWQDSAKAFADSINNFEPISYFGTQAEEVAKYDKILKEREGIDCALITNGELLQFKQLLLVSFSFITINFYLAVKLVNGVYGVGDLVLVNGLFSQVFTPIFNFGEILRNCRKSLIDLASYFDIIDKEPEVKDKPNAKVVDIESASIKLDRVNFAYKGNKFGLRDISFEIKPYLKTAIVGETGSGKSTIIKLLYRFYLADLGNITFDGINIENLKFTELKKAIGILPQDVILFNNTLLYNLCYGVNKKVTDKDLVRAVEYARLVDFVERLPMKYDTYVGERGIKLSRGERQRLSLARLFLRNPKLFILDEPTSSLDLKTEYEVIQSINEMTKGKTTLVISHRLNCVVDADNIIVMSKGEMIESGTHEELLANHSYYYSLWIKQNQQLDYFTKGLQKKNLTALIPA